MSIATEPAIPAGPVLSPVELADRWGMSAETLRKWRRAGIGPVFAKFGSVVRYLLEDVLDYERGARQAVTA